MKRQSPKKTDKSKSNRYLSVASMSHKGLVRSSNQDWCRTLEAPHAPLGADALLLVADGMGGHQAGDVASRMTVDGLVQELRKSGKGKPSDETQIIIEYLRAGVQNVNALVWEKGKEPKYRGMGTTLTAALIRGTDLVMANAGDSRGYLLREGRLRRVTRDHSWVEEQVEAGQLSHDQADRHPNRNIITRAIGIAATVEVDIFHEELREDDVVVMCTDGLYSLVTDHEVEEVVAGRNPSEACRVLVDMANGRGGHDNITVVIARIMRLKGSGASSRVPTETSRVATLQDKTVIGKAGTRRTLLKRVLRISSSPLWIPPWVLMRVIRSLAYFILARFNR